jgi:hypothetical protein
MKGRVHSCANHNGKHVEQFRNLLIHMHSPWVSFLFEQLVFQHVFHRDEHFPEVHILASRACDQVTRILRSRKLFDVTVASSTKRNRTALLFKITIRELANFQPIGKR